MNLIAGKNQLKQLEQLAHIGFWEWNVSSSKPFISEGINSLFYFISTIDYISLINYLRNNQQYSECTSLINYLKQIKNNIAPENIVVAIKKNNQIEHYFEFKTQQIINDKKKILTGTVQEVSDSIKYNRIKQKEILFEKKISEIASRFLVYDDFESDLTKSLAEIGQMLNADHAKILNIQNNHIKEEFIWSINNQSSNNIYTIKNLPSNETKFYIELLKDRKFLCVNSIDDLPVLTNVSRKHFERNSDMSFITSGITVNKQTVGALYISRKGKYPNWDFSDIHIIKMVSIILGNALEQHKTQKELKTSEKRLQFALLAGNLGTWEYDIEKRKVFFDERFSNTFGYSNNTLNKIPEWLKKNIHPRFLLRYNNALEKCFIGESNYYSLELQIKCNDGHYKWVHDWGIVTKTNQDNEPVKMVGIIQDISSHKQMEDDLIIAKKEAENNEKLKTAFLANMSHEIRTPMNGITGFAELLYNNQVSDCDKQQYFEVIWKNSTRLLGLINNILDIAKLETSEVKIFEREANLNKILLELEHKYNQKLTDSCVEISFEKPLDEQSAFVLVDEARLKQIIENIIGNSIKFTKTGFIKISYHINNQHHLEFKIQDSGLGIDHKQSKIIFKRFGQTENAVLLNKGGAGLGLPIAKGLLELMNGDIWFNSQRLVGSTFYFTIPYKPTRLGVKHL